MPTTEKIYPEYIHLDGGTQPRSRIDPEVCDDYAERMKAGVEFPPLDVYFDGQEYWLADGFHRLKASVFARPGEPMECNVYQGTLEDAQWHSYGVNKTHGLRRTNEDKARAVKSALRHPRAEGRSNHHIAEHCGVSEAMVRKRRNSATAHESQSRLRTGRDGRTINTANIGKRTGKGKKWRCQGVELSPEAHMPKLGHSPPNPMIPLQFSPNNARTAAATLIREFSRQWVESLIQELTRFLTTQGGTAS